MPSAIAAPTLPLLPGAGVDPGAGDDLAYRAAKAIPASWMSRLTRGSAAGNPGRNDVLHRRRSTGPDPLPGSLAALPTQVYAAAGAICRITRSLPQK